MVGLGARKNGELDRERCVLPGGPEGEKRGGSRTEGRERNSRVNRSGIRETPKKGGEEVKKKSFQQLYAEQSTVGPDLGYPPRHK